VNFLSQYYSFREVEVPGFIVKEWGCRVRAFGRRVPCLPAGLGSSENFVVAGYVEFENAGTLVFDGKTLPRVRRVLTSPALAIPTDFKELVIKSMREGDFEACSWGEAEGAVAYVRRGRPTCVITFYDALWYGFAHSATALATLSVLDTTNTLILVPRYSRWEDLLTLCDTAVVIDGIGVSPKGLGSEDLYLTVGGITENFGSPFDTPDKLDLEALRRHFKLLSSLAK